MSFEKEVISRIKKNGANKDLLSSASKFMLESIVAQYSYNFSWLGRPIIQYPQDMVAVQELIWKVKPDLIIETGIAHGGSLVLSASMLALIDYCTAVESGNCIIDPDCSKVLGIDIEIRPHNKAALESHPLAKKITMIEGSSTDPAVIGRVHEFARNHERIMIFLDSMHTHDHVLAELEAYAPFTSIGSYCVVFDTIIDNLPDELYPDRPWSRGDNPQTAVSAFLQNLSKGRTGIDGKELRFETDKTMENKILITVAPNGYLKRI
jgi:cephalosporin hydroxylase